MPPRLPRLNAWLHSPDDGPELPIPHRLTLAYLVLPLIVWLVGWFEWWVGIPAAVLLTAGFWNALRGSWWVPPQPAVVVLPIVAAGWVLLTPAGGVVGIPGADTSDWFKHRALFFELGANVWPVRPTNPLAPYLPAPETDAGTSLLRYYLGWYMVPGLAARWLGVEALNWAVPVWHWGGVALVVWLFTAGCRGWRETAAAVAILVCFSGMDLLRNVLLHGPDWVDWSTAFSFDRGGVWPTVGLSRSLAEWPRFDGAWVYLQYSANTTGLMFLPQHTVSAALGALLVVQMSDRPRFLAVSGVVLVAVVFWSPFVALGLLPLLAVPLFAHGLRPFLRWQNLLLVPPVGLLLVAYLTSGAQEVPNAFLWEKYDAGILAKLLPVFWLTEFGALAALLVWLRPRPEPDAVARRARSRNRKKTRERPPSWSARGLALVRREPFLAASVATLFLLPVYSFGAYNDLPMNSSKPAVIVLGYCCVRGIVAFGRNGGGKGSLAPRLALGGLVGVLAVGAFTPLVEIVRAGNHVGEPWVLRYERGPYSLFVDLVQRVEYQYVTDDVPSAVRVLLRAADDAGTAPAVREKGALIVDDDFDVYLDGKRLIYAKMPCSREDTERIFVLNVAPVDPHDLSDVSRRAGRRFDNLNFTFAPTGWRRGATCVIARRLPEYAIDRIVVGQGVDDRPVWIREYRFGRQHGADG